MKWQYRPIKDRNTFCVAVQGEGETRWTHYRHASSGRIVRYGDMQKARELAEWLTTLYGGRNGN